MWDEAVPRGTPTLFNYWSEVAIGALALSKSSGCFENRFGQAKMRANLSWARFPNLPLDFHRAFPHALVQMFASRWSDLRCARTNNRSASCRDTLNCKFGCARRGPLSLSWVFGRARRGPLVAFLLLSERR